MKINLGLAALAAIALTSPVLAADVVRAPVRVPAAAAVASPLTGDVSFFAGFQEGPFSEHHGIFGGEGRFAWGLGSAMVLQGDAGGQSRVDSDGFGSSTFALTGHLYNRGMGGALGVKVDVENLVPIMAYTAGLEGQLFMGNLTLGAELNGGTYTLCDCTGMQARGLARLYLNPNTRLQFDAAWWGGDFWSNNPWSVAASISQRMAGTPFNLGAQLRYDDINYDTSWSGRVSLTVNFDRPGSTTLSHDREVVFDSYRAFWSGGP